ADLDELGIAAGAVEGAEEGVDAVAGVAVDPVDAPLGQPFEHVVSDEFRHLGTSLLPAPRSRVLARPARRQSFGLRGSCLGGAWRNAQSEHVRAVIVAGRVEPLPLLVKPRRV